MPKRVKRRTAAPMDANRLHRVEGGRYRSEDDRFEVRHSGVGWLLVDSRRTDELGQPVVLGPYAALDAVRHAMPGAREQQ